MLCTVHTYSYWFYWIQEPCIEEHCHDSWFPGTNLLSNLHHVINFVRVRVPETAPEVKREAPPSTSTEASSYGQVKKKKTQLNQNQQMRNTSNVCWKVVAMKYERTSVCHKLMEDKWISLCIRWTSVDVFHWNRRKMPIFHCQITHKHNELYWMCVFDFAVSGPILSSVVIMITKAFFSSNSDGIWLLHLWQVH